jgi:hypothetical protein
MEIDGEALSQWAQWKRSVALHSDAKTLAILAPADSKAVAVTPVPAAAGVTEGATSTTVRSSLVFVPAVRVSHQHTTADGSTTLFAVTDVFPSVFEAPAMPGCAPVLDRLPLSDVFVAHTGLKYAYTVLPGVKVVATGNVVFQMCV